MNEIETNGIMINGELQGNSQRRKGLSLGLLQIVVIFIMIGALLVTKFFMPETYEDIREEYMARMFDPVFASDDSGGLRPSE